MARQIDVHHVNDHIAGNFQWEKEPTCSCGKLKEAVDDQILFVSNFVAGEGNEETNQFYMMPVDAEGHLVRSKGIPITNCPWCGDRIVGRKKYPTQPA